MSKAMRPLEVREITYDLPLVMILLSPTEIEEAEPRAISSITNGFFVGLDDGEGLGVEVCVCVAFAGISTPLSQTSFLPCLMQVYFLPLHTIVWPSFVGLRVGPVAANAPGIKVEIREMPRLITTERRVFMS